MHRLPVSYDCSADRPSPSGLRTQVKFREQALKRDLIGGVILTGVCIISLGSSGCHQPPATGQVLATVGGRDVTLQDVRAEGRAEHVPAGAGRATDTALLQRVIDRTLLAQSARAQKLDQTPEAPSDLARVEQSWRAEKAASRILAGLAAPTEAEGLRFIADHPFAFARREQVSARTATLSGSPALFNQLKTYTSFDAALAFAKRLGAATTLGAGQIDTAHLSEAAAAQLASTPVETLLITRPSGHIQLAEISTHRPVPVRPEDELREAKQALATQAAASRIGLELAKLKAQTTIIYQAGYAPAFPLSKPAPAG